MIGVISKFLLFTSSSKFNNAMYSLFATIFYYKTDIESLKRSPFDWLAYCSSLDEDWILYLKVSIKLEKFLNCLSNINLTYKPFLGGVPIEYNEIDYI